jgi:uncharacterized protein
MSIGMYQLTIPPVMRALENLRHILSKGAAHCEARKLDPAALIQFRLFPDMRPLTFQVQVACDMAKGCVARLAGVEAPKFEDDEQSFADLESRIDRTLAFVRGVSAAQIDGTEDKPVTLKTPRGDLNFQGLGYVQGFVLPNVYFHCTTAYNILRHNGVEIGKMDFLGKTG